MGSEYICNTSPLQYLYQLDRLHLLKELFATITIPEAVVVELAEGRRIGIPLPDPDNINWIKIDKVKENQILPLVWELGSGEREVLALALDYKPAAVILDDRLARLAVESLEIPMIGTLGIL